VTFTQNASVATLIQVTFVNSSFTAATYKICNAATQVGTLFPPGPGTTQAIISVNVDTPAGTVLNFTTDPCAAADQPMNFQLSGVGSAAASTTATISFALFTGALIPLDPGLGITAPAANLATVSPEYSATITNSNHVIDVVTTGAIGSQFTAATGSSAAGANGIAPIVLTDSGDLGALITITTAPKTNDDASFGLATSANVFVSGADFSGISRIYISDGGTECKSTVGPGALGNFVQSALNPTSPVTLLLPTDDAVAVNTGFDQTTTAGVRTFRLCVLVDGATFLNPRIILASVDINTTGAGALNPAATVSAAAQTWSINGADFRMSGVKGGPAGNDTVISVNNHGPINASLRRVEIRRVDQTVGPGLAAPSCVVTDVPAATKTFFSNSGGTVRASIDIFNLCSGQAPFIATEAYGLRIVLDMSPANVGVQATRVFPDGRLLSVPVLKSPPVIPGVASGSQFPRE
jgi:hypothetical protein